MKQLMARIRAGNKGVTLIELMIVLVIASILVGGIYTLFMTQQRSYSVQDQVAGVQQDARAALDIMTRDIRMAGFLVGPGSSSGFTDGLINTITLPSGFTFALTPVNSATTPDSITVVFSAQELGVVQSLTGGNQVNLLLSSNVNLNTYFASNPLLVSFDLHDNHRNKVYQVNAFSNSPAQVTVTNFPSGSVTVGGKVYGVKAITYSVTTADGVLRRNEYTGGGAQPLAGDGTTTFVEDLQLAYQVAGSNTWIFDIPAHTWPASTTFANIRMVRINITVRTAVQDAAVQDAAPATQFNQPALEDHSTTLNGPDGFRRRVYTTEVKIRNL